MNNNKQSSIECYIIEIHNIEIQSRLGEISPIEYDAKLIKIEEQSKAMHKVEIVNAVDGFPIHARHMDGEEYYNETFGGSND